MVGSPGSSTMPFTDCLAEPFLNLITWKTSDYLAKGFVRLLSPTFSSPLPLMKVSVDVDVLRRFGVGESLSLKVPESAGDEGDFSGELDLAVGCLTLLGVPPETDFFWPRLAIIVISARGISTLHL